jgi:hypothetical protein
VHVVAQGFRVFDHERAVQRSDPIFRAIGAYMAPGDPPPVKK